MDEQVELMSVWCNRMKEKARDDVDVEKFDHYDQLEEYWKKVEANGK